MRIDRVELTNFRCFESLSFDLNPHFTLFIGDNGSGKTAIVEALAVAAGVWLAHPPERILLSSGRHLAARDARRVLDVVDGGIQARDSGEVFVWARGYVLSADDSWVARFTGNSLTGVFGTTSTDGLISRILDLYAADQRGQTRTIPVIAYYGAYRGRSSSGVSEIAKGQAMRWAAFFDCLSGAIPTADVSEWFKREFVARGERAGEWRNRYRAVRQAALSCVPGAEELYFDSDSDQVALSITGVRQPLSALSAGQRMMFAMVADIAIKCVTQNAYLLNDDSPYKAIEETPGIVLIDELDVHLHPKWQRGVAASLKKAFPKIQFVCTSHSPQIIGELHPDEIRILEDGKVFSPPRSFGMDSNRVLEIIQDAEPRNKGVKDKLAVLFSAIESNDFDQARKILASLEAELGEDDPELSAAKSTMAFIESE